MIGPPHNRDLARSGGENRLAGSADAERLIASIMTRSRRGNAS
jgi:hypothetical protein